MSKSNRRIDQLIAIALDCGFGNEDAKDFGKLTKTSTWEAMLETYCRQQCRHRRKRLIKTCARGRAVPDFFSWSPHLKFKYAALILSQPTKLRGQAKC
jgi:hypothetical protein